MSIDAKISDWIDVSFADGFPVVLVKQGAELDFIENPPELAARLEEVYERLVSKHKVSTCLMIFEPRVAPSALVRLIAKLYKACKRKNASFYLAEYPSEYLISLSVLGLPQQPLFRLRRTRAQALAEMQSAQRGV
jgi:hypothetical protein